MGGIIKVNLLVVVMAIMLASMHFHGTAAQTTHVVGDAFGWNIPAAGASDYATWASRRTFAVGDVLLFNFTTGPHTVAEVAQAAYGPCTTANPISVATAGPARIPLTAAGAHYYVCTIGTHCQLGQKLSVNVVAGGSAAPSPAPSATVPPPTATTSPSGSATPTPAGTATPPPPADSFAPSFTAAVPATLLAMALALFY